MHDDIVRKTRRIAVILPDEKGSYDYYDKNNLFPILKSNIENDYIYVVKWREEMRKTLFNAAKGNA